MFLIVKSELFINFTDVNGKSIFQDELVKSLS